MAMKAIHNVGLTYYNVFLTTDFFVVIKAMFVQDMNLNKQQHSILFSWLYNKAQILMIVPITVLPLGPAIIVHLEKIVYLTLFFSPNIETIPLVVLLHESTTHLS
jgi:hypothetical protein